MEEARNKVLGHLKGRPLRGGPALRGGPSMRGGSSMPRVVRGGSFADGLEFGRTANRGHSDPAYGRQTIGFRCVAD